MPRTFVIAEASGTHDGNLNNAIALVDNAKAMGADAVKFQYCSSPNRLAQRRRAPEYIEAYKNLQFPYSWFPELAARANDLGIEFMCTVYLPEDIPVIDQFVKRFKISSFEARDTAFVNAHLEFDKPLIVSCGMGADDIVIGADDWLGYVADVSYLYCVSAYPTPIEQINLAKLLPDEHGGKVYDGLSDHTIHPLTGALAVATGVKIIEFHTRLNETSVDNADYAVSRDPLQSYEYIQNVRLAETMMGSRDLVIQECEMPMLKYRVGT